MAERVEDGIVDVLLNSDLKNKCEGVKTVVRSPVEATILN
jgi:hypothetical protein